MLVSFVFSANQKSFVICIRVTEELHSFLSQSELGNLERFPEETSRADSGKSQSQRQNDSAIVLHQTAGNTVLTGQTQL